MTKISNLDLARGSGRVASDLFEETGGEYKTGWMPKYPPTLYDIQKVHRFGSKTYLNFLWNRYMTNYFEGFYDGWYNTDEAIPMKYLGGGEIDRTQNFTTDLELLMDNFVKQHYYKESLDQAYAFGNGLKLYLKSIEDADSNINFKRMREWFEVSINLHILGHKSKDITLTRRAIRRSDVDAFKRFNWAKFLRSLKLFFSGVTMWLKPVSGLANYTFAHLLSVKEAVKNQIGNYENTDFKIKDLQHGFNAAKKLMLVDAMNGTWRNNKAFVLMDKFRYLPDNYDWFTMPNQLLTANNKLFTTRTMYMFHTMPEEYLATAMFVAQLNSMKTPDGKSV